MKLILASSSPRRQDLLTRLALPFTVMSANIDESMKADEQADSYIRRMVANKANTLLEAGDLVSLALTEHFILLLTADTIGVLTTGQVLLKPTSKADAFAMWQQMAGTHHQVWTAVQATLINSQGKLVWSEQIVEMTKVFFTALTKAEMETYWQTGEPADKAGGYAIQGLASAWVNKIEGSYTNVVGLPLAQTKALIEQAQNVVNLHSN